MDKTVEAILIRANEHLNAGRLPEAEAGYRQVLSLEPGQPIANYNLGILLINKGEARASIPLIEAALVTLSGYAEVWIGLINAHISLGEHGRAREILLKLRATGLNNPLIDQAGMQLGEPTRSEVADLVADLEAGRFAPGKVRAEAFVKKYDWHPLGWRILSDFSRALNQRTDAIAAMRRAVELDRDNPETLFWLAAALLTDGQSVEAEDILQRVIGLDPAHVNARINLGAILNNTGRIQDALVHLPVVVALNPHEPSGYLNQGYGLGAMNRTALAANMFRRATRLDPRSVDAWSNLGLALIELRDLHESTASFKRVIEIDRDNVHAHTNLAMSLLTQGDFDNGWREYEWRKRRADFQIKGPPHKQWQGQPLSGKTIALYPEQGLGDILQFCRYANLASQQGARVILESPQPLTRLMRGLTGAPDIVADAALVEADYYAPLMSLPGLFGTRLDSIPAQVPYLRVNDRDFEHWRQRMAPIPGLRTGLVWAGQARPEPSLSRTDQKRSVSLQQLLPLAQVEGISWISLQKGSPVEQIRQTNPAFPIIDHTDDLNDFYDTAALVANLDLVITVDTSVAHLAGALGKRVWVLSRFDGCWRWLDRRDDSPWYPTMRLFHQETPGDWTDAIMQMKESLEELKAELRN
jgi:tetratricopeptide (TPR) repeat protein